MPEAEHGREAVAVAATHQGPIHRLLQAGPARPFSVDTLSVALREALDREGAANSAAIGDGARLGAHAAV